MMISQIQLFQIQQAITDSGIILLLGGIFLLGIAIGFSLGYMYMFRWRHS